MSDVINALKGFPFEQFFCLLMFGLVVVLVLVFNKTLIKLNQTLFGLTFTLDKAIDHFKKCQDSGKIL